MAIKEKFLVDFKFNELKYKLNNINMVFKTMKVFRFYTFINFQIVEGDESHFLFIFVYL